MNRANDTRRGQIPEVLVRVRLNLIEFENTIENLVLDVLGSLKEKRHRAVLQQRKNREKDHDGNKQRADRIGYVPSKVLDEQRRNNHTDLAKQTHPPSYRVSIHRGKYVRCPTYRRAREERHLAKNAIRLEY